jgi:hypothetical protein
MRSTCVEPEDTRAFLAEALGGRFDQTRGQGAYAVNLDRKQPSSEAAWAATLVVHGDGSGET